MSETIAEMIQSAIDNYIKVHGKEPVILVLNELAYRVLKKYCSRIQYSDYRRIFSDVTIEPFMYRGMEIAIYKKEDESDIVRLGVG